jgi:hypothetical protein
MTDWIELIRPYTKHIVIDKQKRGILLIHPHFQKGKTGYKSLIKALVNNKYNGYEVTATGFVSLRGLIIIRTLMKHLQKLKVIEKYSLSHSLPNPLYTLVVTLK